MKKLIRFFTVVVVGISMNGALVAEALPSPAVQSVVTIEGIEYPVFELAELPPLKQVQPDYPYREGEQGKPGKVVVVVLVDRQGKPAEVQVKLSEPSSVFGYVAVKAVKKWQFRPAQWKGRPTEYIVQVPLLFRVAG